MAELASGAVTSVLGVIRDEALLLSSVQGDVQFIKQEMESMNGFLVHLARCAPPGGEHDEQVRTWMNQVRLLAQDCNNCITIYRYHGDPDIHRARDGLRRYIWWLPWFVRKVVAQHDAAIRLRELKDQARDISERRQRYGVEVPARQAVGLPALVAGSSPVAVPFDVDNEAVPPEDVRRRRAILEPHSLHDYIRGKLADYMDGVNKKDKTKTARPIAIVTLEHYRTKLADVFRVKKGKTIRSVDIVAPNLADGVKKDKTIHSVAIVAPHRADLADEALAIAKARHFKRNLLVNMKHDYLRDLILLVQPSLKILHCILYQLQQEEISSSGECGVEKQELNRSNSKSQSQQSSTGKSSDRGRSTVSRQIRMGRRRVIREIRENMQVTKVRAKFDEIKSKIEQIKSEELEDMSGGRVQSIDILRHALCQLNDKQNQSKDNDIVGITATMLKDHMERDDPGQPGPIIRLDKRQYVHILENVFPTMDKEQVTLVAPKTTSSTSTSQGDDRIREIIDKVKLEIPQELRQENKPGDQGQIIKEAVIDEIKERLAKILRQVRQQLEIKGMLDRIKHHLKDDEKTLIIINYEGSYLDGWVETVTALNLVGCIAGVILVLTSPWMSQPAEVFCHPPGKQEPIYCSLVGQYYDSVLQLTSQQRDKDNYNPQIFRNILKECEPYENGEFCMKIFAHALYSNPKVSNEELHKLHSSIQTSPKSVDSVAMKMLNFSYSDLPKEYRSCLLYLSIFPEEYNIRRSTVIGRWVVEGLISQEDWPGSVRQANRCFDMLIDRYLVYPGDIDATGKVKSCRVSGQVHQFITKIAKSQHIVETRLSHHLACHFSIFNDLHLRGSDTIDIFFKQLISGRSEPPTLKVLDLEGCCCCRACSRIKDLGGCCSSHSCSRQKDDVDEFCSCPECSRKKDLEAHPRGEESPCIFKENPCYLKVICNKMILLKYLSLRGTNITKLPNEINKLHELEILDIRQTRLPASATKHVVLLRLRRLLAGHRGIFTGSNVGTEDFSSVWIPDKIEKMENVEVISNVKAQNHGQELKDIGSLWRLKKFGVVIQDKKSHLDSLLEAISNLHECLQSLSITLLPATKRSGKLRDQLVPPKLLPSAHVHLEKLAKVTLANTLLTKDDLEVLADLKRLRCLKLRNIAIEWTDGRLTFKKNKFPNLSYFLVEGVFEQGPRLTEIIFEDGETRKLEKIVLSHTNIMSIQGLHNLKKLELKNNGEIVETNEQRSISFEPNNEGNYGQAVGNEDDGAATTRFPFCWKSKA